FQGKFGEASKYWIYLLKTVLGGWFVWTLRMPISEMRWRFSGAALVAGAAAFLFWIGLDGWYPKLGGSGPPWNPPADFPGHPALSWFFVTVRLIGSVLVVPPLEEVF